MSYLLEEAERVSVAILGSTGSIGRQALEVVRSHPERFEVAGLAAGRDVEALMAQAKEFEAPMVALADGEVPDVEGVQGFSGEDSAVHLVESSGAQLVLNAIVGAAGLKATMAAITAGKTLALANKESLVAAGEAVMAKASPGQIRPVDSEHSAIWQLLEGEPFDKVRRIILTGSGGPFRNTAKDALSGVSVQDALAHPVWEMGPKITIDSATMMNKGLEVIEAHFLFGLTYDEIDVAIHPQGLVHGMVEMSDGSVLLHAAKPDMRLPIQVALMWPQRTFPPADLRIDWTGVTIEFQAPDREKFPCLDLAYDAGRRGDTYPAVLNAANEVAVRAFLDERITFDRIPSVIEEVLNDHHPSDPRIEEVLEQDGWARARAAKVISAL